MLPSTIVIVVLSLATFINGAAIDLDSGIAGIDVPIPRGYTREEYFKSVVDYWTPERMASAQSMHPILTKVHEIPFHKQEQENQMERILTPSTLSSEETTWASFPPCAGRIFFTMNNLNYACSGSVVNAANRDTIVTAGHCVYNSTDKQWSTNLVFIPLYDNGNFPYGKFAARRLTTTQAWQTKVDYNNDVAIVLVNTDEQTRHVQDLTKGFGITLNAAKTATINAFGYPLNMNNGMTMSTCVSQSSNPALLIQLLLGFKGIAITCGMGGGASGGPWIQNYNNLFGQQVSLTSFSSTLAAGKIHGPLFTDQNIGPLYNANQNA